MALLLIGGNLLLGHFHKMNRKLIVKTILVHHQSSHEVTVLGITNLQPNCLPFDEEHTLQDVNGMLNLPPPARSSELCKPW